MDFNLIPELIEQIIFAMEDQQNQYYVHRNSGELLREDEIEEDEVEEEWEDPFVPIPAWRPVDGFLMMEKFVARLRNPLLREQLKEALASGRGVFRKFKDILKTSPEVERLWFIFKERELRKVVWQWYNDHRELAGLQRLEEEPEEQEGLEDLLGSDFAIVPLQSRHGEALRELDERAFAVRFPEADPEGIADLFKRSRAPLPDPESEDSVVFVAETPEQDFAGFVWAVEESDPLVPGRILWIQQLAVVQRYQGVGLGSMLLRRMIVEARDRGYHRLRSDLSGTGLQLADFFQGLGFQPISQTMELDPTYWEG
ncbi:MAG: GNAT family N-acetyltransferase [Spirochaetaceae bacterium]|nr:MAG: GNAT family N-acetyltransferase [Spirochaetaceae bacterium]